MCAQSCVYVFVSHVRVYVYAWTKICGATQHENEEKMIELCIMRIRVSAIYDLE